MAQYTAGTASASCGGSRNVYGDPAMRDPVMNFLDALASTAAAAAPVRLPALYRRTRVVTVVLFFAGLVAMYVDLYFSLTQLGIPVYIVWCLSCASMFFTNQLAMKEWKEKNGQ